MCVPPHCRYRDVKEEQNLLEQAAQRRKNGGGGTGAADEDADAKLAAAAEAVAEAQTHNRALDGKALLTRVVHLLVPAVIELLGDNKQVGCSWWAALVWRVNPVGWSAVWLVGRLFGWLVG